MRTVFALGWDDNILAQWADTDNEYAVLSTYPPDASDFIWERPKDGPWEVPRFCGAKFEGSCVEFGPPNVDKVLGGRLEFQQVPCRARDVPADPEARHIFLGEEFSRAARLWTNGYDWYSPSQPVIGVWYEGDKGKDLSDWVTDDKEA